MKSGTTEVELAVPVSRKDHILGPMSAPITLVEYGDYQCPYCGEAFSELAEVLQRLGNRLCFVYRHFPLVNVHPNAESAAETAESAGAQGKFWEMHDLLFQNQDALEPEDYAEYAIAIGMDAGQLEEDLESGRYINRVREYALGGVKSGVHGTPSFFINGARYEGEYDANTMLEALLKAANQDL